MNKRIKKKQLKKKNKKLCERYPFLIPHNRFTGKVRKNFNYSYTELDDMPKGWRKAFGVQMCEEIREELIKFNYLYNYRIVQIKEKYGGLRWYSNGIPTGCKVFDIIEKYEHLSYDTCILCGRAATKVSIGWISPFCNKCAEREEKKHGIKFVNIEESEW